MSTELVVGGQMSLDDLAAEIRREIEAAETGYQSAIGHAVRAGELLIKAKAQVAHGEWLPWLETNFDFSRSTAANYMRLAANVQHVAHLPSIRDAIAHLAEGDGGGAIDLGGLKSSEHVDWYTPARYIDAARDVLGDIDLDPASSPMANETVGASQYYSIDDDGLSREWYGRVWLNPPYGKGSGQFTAKLVEEYDAGRVQAAVLLLNAYGFDSQWFQPLWNHPICFTNHRIEFTSPQHQSGGPANANIFIYLGPNEAAFAETFAEFGAVIRRIA